MATKIEAAAQIMEHQCTHDAHGYAQDYRNGDGTTETLYIDGQAYTIPGGDADCSSAVLRALSAAGINTNGATYTGNMRQALTATGDWVWEPMSFTAQRGDIYLNEASHTAMCTSVVPDMLAEFSINSFGGITGDQQGDQTGYEAYIHGYYVPWCGWDGILHYVGEGQASGNTSNGTTSTDRVASEGSGVTYEVHVPGIGWLGAVSKCDSTEDGYAGWMDYPIDGLRAYRHDGHPLTIRVHMTAWDGYLQPTTFTGSLWGANKAGDGYAGSINSGAYIDGVIVEGCGINVAPAGGQYFGWTNDGQNSDGDGYAGEYGVLIAAVQMRV